MSKLKQIVFTQAYRAEYLTVGERDFQTLGDKEVVVKTVYSTVSAGTERANFVGDKAVSVFSDAEVPFPRTVGYSSAGEVVAVGACVTKVKVGDRVSMIWSKHANYNILPEDNVVKIESDKVSYEEAALGLIATFPLAAFKNGYEEYGWDILSRVIKMAERDGRINFLYSPYDEGAQNATGPSGWGGRQGF